MVGGGPNANGDGGQNTFRHPSHAYLAERCPEFFARYDDAVRAALLIDDDGDDTGNDNPRNDNAALPAKYRELIVICMLAQLRASESSIAGHIARAMSCGLTEDELVEGFQAAYVPGGAPVLMHAVRSLTQYKQTTAEPVGGERTEAG